MGSAFAAWMWRREREVKNTCLATQRSYCLSFASPSMHHIDTAIYLHNYSFFDCPKTNLGTANRGLPRGYPYLRGPPIGCLPGSQGQSPFSPHSIFNTPPFAPSFHLSPPLPSRPRLSPSLFGAHLSLRELGSFNRYPPQPS